MVETDAQMMVCGHHNLQHSFNSTLVWQTQSREWPFPAMLHAFYEFSPWNAICFKLLMLANACFHEPLPISITTIYILKT